jgi:alanine dehydrogenase
MTHAGTLILTRSDVVQLLRLEDCIGAVEEMFRAQAEGRVPPPGILGYHVPDGGFHIKAAGAGKYFAAKVNANFPGNPTRYGLSTIQGIVALYDAERGTPLAIMDSIEITAQRTAAATAVAARHLAGKDAAVATIVGCGVQGRFQLEAIGLVRPIRRAYAVDSSEERRTRFVADMGARLDLEVLPGTLRDAAGSDIVVTCTTSRVAIVTADLVKPGAFIGAVGADNPEKQEIDPQLMRASRVVVDHLDQCLSIGDLHHAVEAGVMTAADVAANLGEVVAGLQPGRQSPEDIVVFDSTGTALQDVAAARMVYESAVRKGVGRPVSLGD